MTLMERERRKRFIRVIEFALLAVLCVIYIFAKTDFFTRYGSRDYVAGHWPYWLAMGAVLALLVIFETLGKLADRSRSR